MTDLTLIIPAKKEKESLPKVLQSLEYLNYKIIVSLPKNDLETINSVKNFNILIHEQMGNGYGNSITEAINKCSTKYFCIFNADGSFEYKDLEKMLIKCKNNDFVFASRYLRGGGSDDDTIITYIGNKIFSLVGRLLFSLNLSDILYTYVLGKTSKFKELNIKSNDFRFCVEFPIKIEISKMNYASIPSYEKKRIGGKKKVNELKDGFLILSAIIKLFFKSKIFRKKIID
tara:strand:- start:568 stop:1257 length:690 start_codon:yes stop_codon:yes gene_type:complete